ncbi:MAG TPA: peptidase M23 [Bacteroidales bacterium]|jgi:murein DD-endopeptidase MepM/ murein hydrolase activator NlpD|nr:peptidase M23 [Bacteroidales bacterium]
MHINVKNTKNVLFRNIKSKYRLVIQDAETFEEKFSLKLSRLNVFITLGILIIGLIILTTYLIAFTSLKEYIPGYSDPGLSRKVYELTLRADSLELLLNQRAAYLENIQKVLMGNIPIFVSSDTAIQKRDYSKINDNRIVEDSMLRQEVENQDKYELKTTYSTSSIKSSSISSFNFFRPVNGYLTSHFDPSHGHYGVDIATAEGETVKAVFDGTVIQAGWNIETGYSITIQHISNLVSIYMHNSSLLRKQGDIIRAGDPIAIAGSTGKLSTGTHLHFELWYNGTAVDPLNYITF